MKTSRLAGGSKSLQLCTCHKNSFCCQGSCTVRQLHSKTNQSFFRETTGRMVWNALHFKLKLLQGAAGNRALQAHMKNHRLCRWVSFVRECLEKIGRNRRGFLERFAFEKGETRGGGTAASYPKWTEKHNFFRETAGRMRWNTQRFKLTMPQF